MKFTEASAVEVICSSMLMADQPRATDRANINNLFNGQPPYAEAIDGTNVNFLEAPNIAHHGRGQLYSAFCNPDPLFTLELDYGPTFKRREWADIMQREMNKIIKRSDLYLEVRQSTFANVVLHGPGPSIWEDREHWQPDDLGVEDVLLPANTFRSMKGLTIFAIRRSYTVPQLQRLTRGRNVDPAWNMPLVKKVIEWADRESSTLLGDNYTDSWSPEKIAERIKGSEYYYCDAVPAIQCFDFYFHDDNKKTSGWKRRMILDAWSNPGVGARISGDRKFQHGKGDFLYNSQDRIYADHWNKILHFNFADCSSVAPFRYHSVRSLGYLLYSICHLQNRLRCKFSDAAFESTLQYFRVANPNDADRLMKINLTDKGVLEDGVQFVRPEERWKVDSNLVMGSMGMNRQSMQENSSSFTQDFDQEGSRDETATRTMAKVNATTALVGAMLNQAYNFQTPQYREIARRFSLPDSSDLDVKKFRVRCLKQGVPAGAINFDAWNIQPVRIIGSGNKLMASAIADKMMAIAARLDPTAQREVDRMYIAANSDDWGLADRLVPRQPVVTNTIHDTEIIFGAIMQGTRPEPLPGLNPAEVVETMMKQMGMKIQRIMQTDGVGTPADVEGLQACAQYTDAFIQMLAQDKNEKARVAAYSKQLGAMMNEVKGMAQRQQQAAQASAQAQPGGDPKAQAQIEAAIMTAQTKAKISADAAAQKQAQKRITFEEKTQMDAAKTQQKLQQDQQQHAANLQKTAIETAHAVELQKLQAEAKPEPESP